MLNWLPGKEGKECKFDHLHLELKAYLYFFCVVSAFDAMVYDGSNFNRSSRTGSKPLLASNFSTDQQRKYLQNALYKMTINKIHQKHKYIILHFCDHAVNNFRPCHIYDHVNYNIPARILGSCHFYTLVCI